LLPPPRSIDVFQMQDCKNSRDVIYTLCLKLKEWSGLQEANYEKLFVKEGKIIAEGQITKRGMFVDRQFTVVQQLWELVCALFPKDLIEEGWKGEF
jgi:hypothetical protein